MYTFDQIYTPANRRSVMNACFRILGNIDDAEDATQTAFMKAFANLHTYEGRNGAAVNTWLLTIARNAAFTQLQTRPSVIFVSLDMHVSGERGKEGDCALTLADILPDPRQLSPETLLFFREVDQMLTCLPLEWREPLLMVQQGYSCQEIGLVLGMVSALSVRCRLKRARQRMKQAIGHKATGIGKRRK